MSEIMLLLYFISFCAGAATLLLLVLIHKRFGGLPFLYMALLLASAMLFVLGEMLQAYSSLSSQPRTDAVQLVHKSCAYVGTILQLILLPLLTVNVVSGTWTKTSIAAFIMSIMIYAGLWPLEYALGRELVLDGRYAALLIVNASCIACLFLYRNNIRNPEVRRVALVYATTIAIALAFSLAYAGLLLLVALPDSVRKLPAAQLISYAAAVALTIHFAIRHFFQPARHAGVEIPSSFINDFNITHRELQIVEAILGGYTTKQLSRELSISEKTARNHVYAIYVKTRARNHIELANLVQSFR